MTHVEKEVEAIQTILSHPDLGINYKILQGTEATVPNFKDHLDRNRVNTSYQIIHFCGHAQYDDVHPGNSSLILQDDRITTSTLERRLSGVRPVLCFINACQSAKTERAVFSDDNAARSRFSPHGLGQTFYQSGGYFVGNRWKISDEVAAAFATNFYTKVLAEGLALGEAMRASRIACQKLSQPDFGWASYVYYGDPRVRFKRVSRVQPN